MKYLIIIMALLLGGCMSEPDKKHEQAKGELRNELFNKCMELAIKMPRQSDDDVHKVIDECSSHSLYMSNSMMPYGQYRSKTGGGE